MARIKIGNLSRKVMKELEGYGIAAAVEVEKVVDEVAKDTAQTLRNTSPKLTGDYAGAWTYSQGDKTKTRKSKIVHVEKPEYSLSPLLEKGHQNRSGGRTEAKVHIAPVEETAVEQLEKEIRKRL